MNLHQIVRTPRFVPVKTHWMAAVLMVGVLFLSACAESGQMDQQARYNPLSPSNLFPNGQSAQLPVPGSVPFSANGSTNDPAMTGLDDTGQPVKSFPVAVNIDLVQRGQDRYNIFCVPCHGSAGQGDGIVTTFSFPKPPSFFGTEAKGLSVGQIFQVIQNGKGKMFSYAYRVKPPDRWAIIAYLRAMQIKNGAVDPQKLTPDDLQQIGGQ